MRDDRLTSVVYKAMSNRVKVEHDTGDNSLQGNYMPPQESTSLVLKVS